MTKGLTTLRYITFCILMFTQYAFGYSESPLLKKMVKNGELPPVESRLPKTPRIIDYLELKKYVNHVQNAK